MLHATETEPAENVLCGTKAEQQNRQGGTEVFSEKQLEDGYRLACQSHPVGAYEVELPESEETIVLSEWRSKEKTDTEELTEADTQTPAEAKTSGGIQDKETAEGTAEKQKMQFMESVSTSEQRLWRHCL